MQPAQLSEPPSSSFEQLNELDPGFVFEEGERELRTSLLTTNEEATRAWKVIQNERVKRKSIGIEKQRIFVVPDETPLVKPTSQL